VIVLEFRHELDAPPARVFAALTESGSLARWFCDRAASVPAEGGALVLRWERPGGSSEPFIGRWVEFRAPWTCAYEGGHAGYPDGHAGRVAFALAPRGAGTTLVTRHTLPGRPDYEPIAESYRAAWPRALARLTGLLARGAGAPGAPSVEAPAVADPDQLGE
jgi:uncharacterized protein YndB with AHSA1/START domain